MKKINVIFRILTGCVVLFFLGQTRLIQDEFQRTYAFLVPDCHRTILEKWQQKDVGFLIPQLTSSMPLRREAADTILRLRKPVVQAVIEKYKSMEHSWYAEDRWTAYGALADFNVHVDPTPILRVLKKGLDNRYYSVALYLLSQMRNDEAKKTLLAFDEMEDTGAAFLADNAIFWHDVPAYRAKVEHIAKEHPSKWRREEAQKVLKDVWGVEPAKAAA